MTPHVIHNTPELIMALGSLAFLGSLLFVYGSVLWEAHKVEEREQAWREWEAKHGVRREHLWRRLP